MKDNHVLSSSRNRPHRQVNNHDRRICQFKSLSRRVSSAMSGMKKRG